MKKYSATDQYWNSELATQPLPPPHLTPLNSTPSPYLELFSGSIFGVALQNMFCSVSDLSLFVCLFVCLCVCLFVCLCVCYSTSLMCLKTPSEAFNPQSHADMSTRVFWIASSLLESDYEHEFLMAIGLINKVKTRMWWWRGLFCLISHICLYLGHEVGFPSYSAKPRAECSLFSPKLRPFHELMVKRWSQRQNSRELCI